MAEKDERYLRVRRNSIVFSGLLALSILVGFSEVEASSGFFPFILTNPEYIPHIFFVIVIFHAYDYFVNWISLERSIRDIEVNKFDFFIINLFISAYVMCYFWNIRNILSYFVEKNINLFGIILIFIISAIIFSVSITFGAVLSARKKIHDEQKIQKLMEKRLLGFEWILNFNPNHSNGKKNIGFNSDGTIRNGNNNEHSWRVRDKKLEIFNDKGKVFSRFFYNSNDVTFVHTNDPDTLSLRDQYMRRLDIEKLQVNDV